MLLGTLGLKQTENTNYNVLLNMISEKIMINNVRKVSGSRI